MLGPPDGLRNLFEPPGGGGRELNGEMKPGHPLQTRLPIVKDHRDPSSYKVKTSELLTEEKL